MKILHMIREYSKWDIFRVLISNYDKESYENVICGELSASNPKSLQKIKTIVENKKPTNPTQRLANTDFIKFFRFLYGERRAYKALEAAYKNEHFDIIHAHTLTADGYKAMKYAKKTGTPFVLAVRGGTLQITAHERLNRALVLKILKATDAVYFISKLSEQQAYQQYVPPKYREQLMQKTCVIPNGIDSFWLSHLKEHPDRSKGTQVRLLFVGRIDKNKNIPTTQKAMELLREKGWDASLTIVGRICDNAEYQSVLQNKHTAYLGSMPKEKLLDVYRAHDLLVMPSFRETFGLVYAEAMSQGLPVIYTKGQGFDGRFPEGTVGYHVSADSAAEVCTAMEKILGDYASFSPRCVQGCKSFDWKMVVAEYCDIYDRVISAKNSVARRK